MGCAAGVHLNGDLQRAGEVERLAGFLFRQFLANCQPFFSGDMSVAIGTVKWFNPTKGYGFIAPDDGGKDVFVHISAVEKAGFTSLAEGAKVSYEIITDRGKQSAGNLRIG